MSEDKAASIEKLVQRATQLDALAKAIVELEDINVLAAERANGVDVACNLARLLENDFAGFADSCGEFVPVFETGATVSALAMFAGEISSSGPSNDALSRFWAMSHVVAREISFDKRMLEKKLYGDA